MSASLRTSEESKQEAIAMLELALANVKSDNWIITEQRYDKTIYTKTNVIERELHMEFLDIESQHYTTQLLES